MLHLKLALSAWIADARVKQDYIGVLRATATSVHKRLRARAAAASGGNATERQELELLARDVAYAARKAMSDAPEMLTVAALSMLVSGGAA